MANNHYILQIPQPCKEDWQQMTPGQTGRFCAHCSESVVDFTNLTDSQILALIQSRKGKLCGRLRTEQLNSILETPQPQIPVVSGIKKILAGVLLLLTSREVMAARPKHESAVVFQSKGGMDVPVPDTTNSAQPNSKNGTTVTGKVVDSVSRDPIRWATVRIENKGTGVVTDDDGNFTINANAGDTLEVIYVGYLQRRVVVTGKEPAQLIIALKEAAMLTGDVVVLVGKPTVENKTRRFFGMKPIYRHSYKPSKKSG